ncbi:MAG TPA: hypothetical protein VN851_21280 [Thermoanaerobaculia bacterium]|nr:hypothetical protein [Thermoanaerobaculia bacterium]
MEKMRAQKMATLKLRTATLYRPRKREHPLKNCVGLLVVMMAAMALPLKAESASREVSGQWFLNPQTQNWTCATEPNRNQE